MFMQRFQTNYKKVEYYNLKNCYKLWFHLLWQRSSESIKETWKQVLQGI